MLNTANLKFKRHSYLKVLSKYTTQNTIQNLQILTTLSSSWQFTTCPTIGLGGQPPPIPRRQIAAPWDDVNGEGDDGGEASSGQLLFSSCSWVRSTKTPPARSCRTPSQTAPCRCSILQSLVDAPSGIDTPTTAPSRSDSMNLFAPWPRGAALCTLARLPPGVSLPFRSVADIWPWMSPLPLVGPCCQTKTVSPTS